MRHTIARGIIVLALLVGAMSSVSGYVTNGHIWGGNVVTYYVNPSSTQLTATALVSAFQTAASAWSQQTLANIQLSYAGSTSGTSLVNNGKNEVFMRNDTSGYVGETYWWYDATGRLVDFDSVFHEGSYRFYVDTGCSGSGGIYLESIATHEFGHGLGLEHSPVTTATMYPTMPTYCDRTFLTLDPDDISGIESLYPSGSSSLPPATPSSLTATAVSASGISLSWSDQATNESGYYVERSTDGATFTRVAQLGQNASSFSDSGLSASTPYYYRVAAFNSVGTSSYSNVASATTSAPAAPSLTVRAVRKGKQLQSDLRWSGVSGSSVLVYRNGAQLITTANDGQHTDVVKSAGTYSYQVCSTAGTGCTNVASATF